MPELAMIIQAWQELKGELIFKTSDAQELDNAERARQNLNEELAKEKGKRYLIILR